VYEILKYLFLADILLLGDLELDKYIFAFQKCFIWGWGWSS